MPARCVAAIARRHFPCNCGALKLYPPSRAAQIEAQLAAFRSPHSGVRGSRLFRALIPPDSVYDAGRTQREARVRGKMPGGLVLNLGSKSARWGEHVVNLDIAAPAGTAASIFSRIFRRFLSPTPRSMA